MEERFGKYVLLKRIAEGGMGEVLLARQRGLADVERMVVLKRIRPSLRDNDTFEEMFVREARISARLNHPNVLQLYEFGRIDEAYFLTFEYVRGEDLFKLRRREPGPWPLEVVMEVAHQLLGGLQHVHGLEDFDGKPLRIVHRDVSPSNIMISIDGVAKVLDFGVALSGRDPTEEGRQIQGKFPYLSPEQIRLQPLDARSDLFSLAAVLFELLTGERLFRRATNDETIAAVLNDEVPPPSTLAPQLPPIVDELILKALARSADRRFQNAEEMQLTVDHIANTIGLKRGARVLARFLDAVKAESETGPRTRVSPTASITPTAARSAGPPNLLLVDDDEENLQALRRTFRNRFVLFAALDPVQALKIVEDNPIHIIITDERMPNMSGIELLTRASEIRPGVLKVITSAVSDSHTLLDAINHAGIHRYVVKPWTPDALRGLVEELLAEKGNSSRDQATRKLERQVAELSERADRTIVDAPDLRARRRVRSELLRAVAHSRSVGLAMIAADPPAPELIKQLADKLRSVMGAEETVLVTDNDRVALILRAGGPSLKQRFDTVEQLVSVVEQDQSETILSMATVLIPEDVLDADEAILRAATDLAERLKRRRNSQ